MKSRRCLKVYVSILYSVQVFVWLPRWKGVHRGATQVGTDIGSSQDQSALWMGIPNHKPHPNEIQESPTHVLNFLS